MAREAKQLRTIDLLGIVWRSFFIQASWSYDRMQSLGFAFALIPALRRLYPDKEERSQRMAAHMEYFNTQPYFASFVLGAAARREEERAGGNKGSSADPAEIKAALMAPLGALGDSFFWGAFRPFVGVAAVAALFSGAWWAPLLYLVLYNAVHIYLRGSLVFAGYATSGDAVALMARYNFTRVARVLKAMTLAMLGCLLSSITVWGPSLAPVVPLPGLFLGGAALVAATGIAVLLRAGATPVKIMLGLAALCLGIALGGII
jgi:PTS system mannose-specific IID component